MILFEKFGQHQPLNRQAERYTREGVPLSLSTLADQVGAGCAALDPILKRIETQVFAAERLHGDDTTVPVLAKGKTDTGRLWTYVRDDRARFAVRVVQFVIAAEGVGLEDPGIVGKMRLRVLAAAIARVIKHRRRRTLSAKGPIVADIGP